MYDLIASFALGLVVPIFSVFVLQNIEGASLKAAGLSFTLYWMARVFTATPLSRFMDKTDGERDEFTFLFIGTILFSTLMLLFVFATNIWHVFLIQTLTGVANSMAVPGWRIIFTDHLDKGKVGLEWSLDDVAIGISTAVSAFVGAWLADEFGFKLVFVLLAILGYTSALTIIPTWHNIQKTAKNTNRLGVPKKSEPL